MRLAGGSCVNLSLVNIADLIERLPSPDRLRERSVALAVLDVAMSPDDDPEDRYFRFDPRDASGVALASMDNGSGDCYYIAYTRDAVFGWGFAHESPMSPFTRTPVSLWPGLLDGMPVEFEPLTRDARFQIADTFMATAAFWSQDAQTSLIRWHRTSSSEGCPSAPQVAQVKFRCRTRRGSSSPPDPLPDADGGPSSHGSAGLRGRRGQPRQTLLT